MSVSIFAASKSKTKYKHCSFSVEKAPFFGRNCMVSDSGFVYNPCGRKGNEYCYVGNDKIDKNSLKDQKSGNCPKTSRVFDYQLLKSCFNGKPIPALIKSEFKP
jgi:hypothetical protein